MLRGIFRTKNLDEILASVGGPQFSLKRTLNAFSVTLIGIGAIIGAGIFATVGTAASGTPERAGAGPSLMLSFVITAVVCGFTALCYAELASMVPISGSAYTYSYATLGELVAWIIGWDLIIEYAIGNVAVAISWAEFFNRLLRNLGIHVPDWLTSNYRTATDEQLAAAPHIFGVPIVFNILAFGIVALITIVLVWGIKESSNFNAVMVLIKILVLLFFIGLALYYVSPAKMTENWKPFQPQGWFGTLTGAAVVFFAYIGFDAVSTAAQEARNPQKDMPIAIIGSLLVCTLLYILVSGIATGIVPYAQLDVPDPIAVAADHAGLGWMGRLIKLGAIAGLSSVILVMLLGQSRVFYSMARDGLLPPFVSRVHPRFRTPWLTSIVTGIGVAIFSAIFTVRDAGSLCSIGTLLAFVIVSAGILVLRIREPNLPRKFKTPLVWFVAPAGAVSALALMASLPWPTWRRLIVWFVIGIVVYFFYGIRHSRLASRDS